MKTAISIPDKLFRQAELFAKRRKTSRSRLYAQAIAEYISRHDPDAIKEAMDRVADQCDLRQDPAVAAATRRILERSEW